MRTSGSDASFEIDLRESVFLEAHGVRIQNCRLTNSFYTTDRGRHIFYRDGSGGIQYFSIAEKAYNGTELAAELQTLTGRTTSYDVNTNSITQSIVTGQEWLSDAELATYSSGFPSGASASNPQSLNTVLGDATTVGGHSLIWIFCLLYTSPSPRDS